MPVLPINSANQKTQDLTAKINFGRNVEHDNTYNKKQKALVTTTTALGVIASTAILAKAAHYSLKPANMFKNIKKSYLANVKFTEKEVISIGAGSCLGGLAGGYLIDKDPLNRRAKRRETVMQIGNISIPILTVEGASRLAKNSGKTIKTLSAICGLIVGVYMANLLMNMLSNVLFENTKSRGVKATDFSAHVDDMVVAANYISDAKFVHYIARIIPLALMFAGNEVGRKTARQ